MAKAKLYHERKLAGKCPTCGGWPAPGKVTCQVCADRTLKYRRDNPQKNLWILAKRRAEEKNLPFNLEPDDIIIPNTCPVLGIPIELNWGEASNNSPTVDKIIPHLGYVRGNIRVISNRANRVKSDSTLEELKALVNYLERELEN